MQPSTITLVQGLPRQLNPYWGPNRALVQRFVSFRGAIGGRRWDNLARGMGYLTLTDLTASEGWVGRRTPAGNPSMRLADSGSPWAQLVYTGSTAGPYPATTTQSRWTVAVWFRPMTHPSGNSRFDVITKHGATPALQLAGDASGGVKMRAFLPATFTSTTILALGPWYRGVWTGDGTNVRFYVNGVLTDTFSNGTAITPFSVFGQYSGALANALHADVDDLVFAARAWTAGDVLADYYDGLSGYSQAFLPGFGNLPVLLSAPFVPRRRSFDLLIRSL